MIPALTLAASASTPVHVFHGDSIYDWSALGVAPGSPAFALVRGRDGACRLESTEVTTISGYDGPDPGHRHSYLSVCPTGDKPDVVFVVTGLALELGPIACPTTISLQRDAGEVRRTGGADGSRAGLVWAEGERRVVLMDPVDTDPEYLPRVEQLDLDRDGRPDWLFWEGIPKALTSADTPRYHQLWLSGERGPSRACRTPHTGSV
jgi:hypothetical protein